MPATAYHAYFPLFRAEAGLRPRAAAEAAARALTIIRRPRYGDFAEALSMPPRLLYMPRGMASYFDLHTI